MYRVIHDFADMTDRYHVYRAGDEFPRPGLEIDEARIKELETGANKIGAPLIEQVTSRRRKKA